MSYQKQHKGQIRVVAGRVLIRRKGERTMSGIVIVGAGGSLIGLAVILFVTSIIYQKTAGKKIREELKHEYE